MARLPALAALLRVLEARSNLEARAGEASMESGLKGLLGMPVLLRRAGYPLSASPGALARLI